MRRDKLFLAAFEILENAFRIVSELTTKETEAVQDGEWPAQVISIW